MRPLCVIPARGGSKRLPFKNALNLAGRPMLDYTIEAARNSGVFDRVYVSTEDNNLAHIAEAAGATVHQRPDKLAGDMVAATDVCLDLVSARERAGDRIETIVCLQPSSPLRTADDVRASWERFVQSAATFLVSVTAIDPHYFHWAVHRTADGWQMYFGDQFLMERTLLPPVFRPNGAIKIGRVAAVRAAGSFFGAPLEVYVMPEERSVHVAAPWDFEVAESALREQARARTTKVV